MDFLSLFSRRPLTFIGIFLSCVVTSSCSSAEPSSIKYLFSAPAILRSGLNHTMSVRIIDSSQTIEVNATVTEWQHNIVITSSIEIIKESGQILVHVPNGHSGKALLHITGKSLTQPFAGFQNSTIITIVDKSTSVFIQTDKPIYKPSQRVYINVYTVNRDLQAVSQNITAYVVEPNNIKIIEWKNLEPSCCGLFNVSFLLSSQPPLGEWKVFVVLERNHYNVTFEVKKYVLPLFEVVITPPSFKDISICEEVVVTAKYRFGKPVEGSLVVNMTVLGHGHSRKEIANAHTTYKNMTQFTGQARFFVCLQDNLSRKHLRTYFTGNLAIYATVTTHDGSSFTAYDDTAVVSHFFIDVEFTRENRKHFKPGIPFSGQLQVKYLNSTPAANVLIQLKVQDQNNIFFKQDIASRHDGSVSFIVPAQPESTNFLWISARVAAIDGVSADHHLTVYHGVHRWFSPSKCNLLIDRIGKELEIGSLMEFSIKSSCPCNFKLHYDILSRGEIVKTGSKLLNHSAHSLKSENNHQSTADILDVSRNCQVFLPVIITASMAPWSKLLIYYIRPDGEGVADSIQFPVKIQFDSKIKMKLPENARPGELINVTVMAQKHSCICMSFVDKSVHMMKPQYLLSKYDIIDEIMTYDMDNLPFDGGNEWHSTSKRRRRYTYSENQLWKNRDSFYAFLESGLIVMTNFVKLNHKSNIQVYQGFPRRQALQQSSQRKSMKRKGRYLRSYFPETWYWNCFDMKSSDEVTLLMRVPDSITSWVASSVSIDPTSGIGLSNLLSLQTFKAFFIEFKLPYSAIRGEELIIPLTIYNFMNSCIEVRLAIVVSPGVFFAGEVRRRLMKNILVPPESTKVMKFELTFQNIGSATISGAADAFDATMRCSNVKDNTISDIAVVNGSEIDAGQKKIIATDALAKNILIEAEGDPREYTHSLFFCPNERINITTHSSSYHFLKLPNGKHQLSFMAKAKSTVHIAITTVQEVTERTYEIILGGHQNRRSWIQKNGRVLNSTETFKILSEDRYLSYWISWSDYFIRVGRGSDMLPTTEILNVPTTDPVNATYIGLATMDRKAASFYLWEENEVQDGFNEYFELDVPKNAIPGSVKGVTTVIGNVMGPTLVNLNNLLKLPYGCGEQNMINFAPNIYIMNYLKTTNQLRKKVETRIEEYLVQGYQRQLTYKRRNGSYSAFGDRDEFGSMWLTAFVLKSFAASSRYIFIDDRELHHAISWISSQQLYDGSFPLVGKIMNKDTQGGINREISLTAYVMISLLETREHVPYHDLKRTIERTMMFLENSLSEYDDPYTAALTAYALTLGESKLAEDARSILLDMSLLSNNYRYWSLRDHILTPSKSFDSFTSFDTSLKQTVASAEVETASYALLAFTKMKNVSICFPIVRWISKQRNSLGGFSSTQDTCAALQALSNFATIAYIGGVNMNITLGAPGNFVLNFRLNSTNSDVLQQGDVPALGSTTIPLFVESSGDGCALLQINIHYNIPNPEGKRAFDISLSMRVLPDKTKDIVAAKTKQTEGGESNSNFNRKTFEVKACVRWLFQGSSNMAVLEYSLLTGYIADKHSLDKTISNRSKSLKRYEVEKSKILFYFDEISSFCRTCVEFQVIQFYETKKIVNQHAKVYDYYEPRYESTIFYLPKFAAECKNDDNCGLSDQGYTTNTPDFDGSYPECKCYKECGYNGPKICGDDGLMYANQCRMKRTSCEKGIYIQPQDESLCIENEIPIPILPKQPNDPDYLFPFFPEKDQGDYYEPNY